jgi:hypothetical protein
MEGYDFNATQSNPTILKGENSFAEIFFHYFSYWKWVVISVIASLFIAFVYLRYAAKEYNVSAKVLINDKKKTVTNTGSFILTRMEDGAYSIRYDHPDFTGQLPIGESVNSPWGVLHLKENPFGIKTFPLTIRLHDPKVLPKVEITPVNKVTTVVKLIDTYNERILAKDKEISGKTANNPIVIRYYDQIALRRDNLLKEIDAVESSVGIALQELKRRQIESEGKTAGLATQERESRGLLRQPALKETLYTYLSQKREEAGLSLAWTTPNAVIIDVADYGDIPVKLKMKIILPAAFLLGLIIPVMIIYVLDLFDNRLRSREPLAKTAKAPFLEDVPVSKSGKTFPALNLRSGIAEMYDYIVVDTPPVGLVADTFRINTCADVTIYVTRADYTRKAALPEIERIYEDRKLRNMTIVINALSLIRRYGYGNNETYYIEDNKDEKTI